MVCNVGATLVVAQGSNIKIFITNQGDHKRPYIGSMVIIESETKNIEL